MVGEDNDGLEELRALVQAQQTLLDGMERRLAETERRVHVVSTALSSVAAMYGALSFGQEAALSAGTHEDGSS